MSISYITLIVIFLKLSKISKGKSKEVKFPNLWLIPILFIAMTFQDYFKSPAGNIFVFVVFGFIGVFIGIIRGKVLEYHRDDMDGKVYYKESYQSLIIYIALIVVKWLLQQFGGGLAAVISLSLLVFACGSIVGRCAFISYQYMNLRSSSF